MHYRKPPPSLALLKDRLTYEPSTGLFYWRNSKRSDRNGELAGSLLRTGYVTINLAGEAYQAHRLAWLYAYGVWPAADLDHINRVKNDNRIANLREATRDENYQNKTRYKRKTLGLPGAYYRAKTGRWESQINFQKRLRFLGSFATEQEAHEAYKIAKQQLHNFHPEVN